MYVELRFVRLRNLSTIDVSRITGLASCERKREEERGRERGIEKIKEERVKKSDKTKKNARDPRNNSSS